MKKNFIPLESNWSAENLLSKIDPEKILADSDFKNKYREFLMCDLRAESDSQNLYRELTNRSNFSDEFYAFLEVWYHDEKNHAAGFRRVIHLLYGDDETLLEEEMHKRTADFSLLTPFFEDEFKLCVLFAYDEYASVLTYQKDSFYKLLGPLEFIKWIKRVTGDEARHFGNAVKLIHHKYQHRLHETKKVMDEILDFENAETPYKSTFLFDHDTEHFLLSHEELNHECADYVYQKIVQF